MSNYDFFLEPPGHAQRWRGYEPEPNALDKARQQCQTMLDTANSDDTYQNVCVAGEKVVFLDFPFALMPGHIYSEAGVDEFRISGCCEYHFDTWFKEEE